VILKGKGPFEERSLPLFLFAVAKRNSPHPPNLFAEKEFAHRWGE
jgi:hypothetical protein